MPGIIVVGAKWGDEGKGKIVDMYANDSDYVVERVQRLYDKRLNLQV